MCRCLTTVTTTSMTVLHTASIYDSMILTIYCTQYLPCCTPRCATSRAECWSILGTVLSMPVCSTCWCLLPAMLASLSCLPSQSAWRMATFYCAHRFGWSAHPQGTHSLLQALQSLRYLWSDWLTALYCSGTPARELFPMRTESCRCT